MKNDDTWENADETRRGIVKRELRKMGNIRKLSNTDILRVLQRINYIEHYEIVQENTKIAIKNYFLENFKSFEPSPKFDKNLDYPEAWIFQDIFRWSGVGFCPVEAEDWEMVGKVVGIITIIAGVLSILVIYPFCIYRSYESKIFEPEREKRKEAEEAKKKKGGRQSQNYGNTDCRVFKRGVKNWKDVCLKINIVKGNF